MSKKVILLSGFMLMPASKLKIKTAEKEWFYAAVLPRPDQNKITFEQTYDDEYDYFEIENITEEQQIIHLSLHWKSQE